MKKSIWIPLMLVLFALFGFSAYQLIAYYASAAQETSAFEALAAQVVRAERPLKEVSDSQDAFISDAQEEAEPSETLSNYAALHEQNPHFFGWLCMEGSKINYPVMYTPEEPEYYLRRAFDGSDSQRGVPFLDAACYPGYGNYLIYGHNMKDGTLFAGLFKYADPSFWKEHPTFQFDTLSESGTYTVLAAFYSRDYGREEQGVFRYYQYTDLRDPDIFAEYMEQVHKAALYHTGIEVPYGTQLLTLSTCSYHTAEGRFVVVGAKE